MRCYYGIPSYLTVTVSVFLLFFKPNINTSQGGVYIPLATLLSLSVIISRTFAESPVLNPKAVTNNPTTLSERSQLQRNKISANSCCLKCKGVFKFSNFGNVTLQLPPLVRGYQCALTGTMLTG